MLLLDCTIKGRNVLHCVLAAQLQLVAELLQLALHPLAYFLHFACSQLLHLPSIGFKHLLQLVCALFAQLFYHNFRNNDLLLSQSSFARELKAFYLDPWVIKMKGNLFAVEF